MKFDIFIVREKGEYLAPDFGISDEVHLFEISILRDIDWFVCVFDLLKL